MSGSRAEKPFSLTGSYYDLSTYFGRACHFFSVTNPFNLLYTSAEITRSKEILRKYGEREGKREERKEGEEELDDRALWKARHIVDSCIHPDTGDVIPLPLRFSAFGLMNVAIIPVMLAPSTLASAWRTVGMHWVNQSYNAAVNYGNRNASSPTSTRILQEAYAAAVLSSCSIALAATALTRRIGSSGAAALAIRSTLPFLACATAGCANVLLIRRSELTDGVEVQDEDGVTRGRSVTAGKIGLLKCCVARVLWNAPIMLVAPLIVNFIGKRPWVARTQTRKFIVENAVYIGGIFVCVPPALAVYPQIDSISADRLEESFQNLERRSGGKVVTFQYNKGL